VAEACSTFGSDSAAATVTDGGADGDILAPTDSSAPTTDASPDGPEAGPGCAHRGPPAGSPCALNSFACVPTVINDGGTQGPAYAFGLAADATYLYWAEQSKSADGGDAYNGDALGRVVRMPKQGGPKEVLTTDLDSPMLVSAEGDGILFTELVEDKTSRQLTRAAKASCTPICTTEAVFKSGTGLTAYPFADGDIVFWEPNAYYRFARRPEGFWTRGPSWSTGSYFSAALGASDFFATWAGSPRIDRMPLDHGIDAGIQPFLVSETNSSLATAIVAADCEELFTVTNIANVAIRAIGLTGATRDVGTIATEWHAAVQDEVFLYGAAWNAGRLTRLRKAGNGSEEILVDRINDWFVAQDDEAVYAEDHSGSTVIYRVPK
jgi:hypothetical protein